MTVKELIEKLKEFPENMRVVNYEFFNIYDVDIEDYWEDDEKVVMIS